MEEENERMIDYILRTQFDKKQLLDADRATIEDIKNQIRI